MVQAKDAFTKGNNWAVLGNMIIAVGGSVKLLARGGLAGLVAAGLVVGGTVVVYFSLDDDEKFVLHYFGHTDRGKAWPAAKYAYDRIEKKIRLSSRQLGFYDKYIKEQGL